MNLQARLQRSRSDQLDTSSIDVIENDESLVRLDSGHKIEIRTIWDDPVDDIEGPLYRTYIANNPSYNAVFVRKTVAQMLKQAAANLPDDYVLIVRTGHRPLDVQYKVLEGVKNKHLQDNPGSSDDAALDFARLFVSDPAIKTPPHCSGAAVDVDVLDSKTNTLVDFGCPMNTDGDISYIYTNKVTPEQARHRKILLTAMLKAGFASNPHEWWHYSYGDQAWAAFYDQPQAIYAIQEPQL